MELPIFDKFLDQQDFVEAGFKLFKLFSRFEYALKRGGFLKKGVHNSAAPDWTTFAAKLGDDFYQHITQRQEAKIIFAKPPLQLMYEVAGRKPDWGSRAYDPDSKGVFEAVKQVRNNLFHGDKSSPAEVARNANLIDAAQFVLIEALNWIDRDDQRKLDFRDFRDRITEPLIF